jgi:hypothetical protein
MGLALRVLVASLLIGGPQVWLWTARSNAYLTVYIGIFCAFLTLKVLEYPRPRWWGGGERLRVIRDAWGRRKMDRLYTTDEPVSELGYFTSAQKFFLASTYVEHTENLCRNYQDTLPLRIGGFALTALFFALTAMGKQVPPSAYSDPIRWLAVILPAGLLLTWDYSRFRRQRSLNHEVGPP